MKDQPMNEDLPYDSYIKSRTHNKGFGQNPIWGKHCLTEIINVLVTPYIKESIKKLIATGVFPNRSEFIRHLIIKFFEENKEWIR